MSEVADDVLLAYPAVGAVRARRVAALPGDVRVSVALDSVRAADDLAGAAREAGRRVGVLVECDMGMRRVGVQTADEAIALARHVVDRRELEYAGITFYPGHIRERVDRQDEALQALSQRLGRTLDALKRAGLPSFRLYDLRATCATMMFRNGEQANVVAKQLGHTKAGFTLEVYGHVQPDMQQGAADRLAGAILGNSK